MSTLFSRLAGRLRAIGRPASKPSLAEVLTTKVADPMEASLQALGRSRKAQVAPALLLATGVGAAFWWWTQWARGSAESEAAAKKTSDPDI